jgi:MFS family permease
MLLGLFLSGTTFLTFGFSKNYELALVLRFAAGSFNGIIGATKTYLSEITNESNQARGFAVFGVARGLGMVVGPIVGGFLCLEETNRSVLLRIGSTGNVNDGESQPLLPTQVKKPKSFFEMVSSRKVVLSLALYTLVSFLFIQFDELFALWSRLPYDEGGLEFDSSTMGKAYAIGGISLFIYQSFFFSPIERYLGTLKTFQAGVIFSIPAFICLPLAGLVRDSPFELWLLIGISQILRACAGVQAFTATFIMISNSITSESRGSLNGIGQTLGKSFFSNKKALLEEWVVLSFAEPFFLGL